MKFRWWWLIMVLLAAGMLVGGVSAHQWDTVKHWAQILCTGCIGLY